MESGTESEVDDQNGRNHDHDLFRDHVEGMVSEALYRCCTVDVMCRSRKIGLGAVRAVAS